MDVIIPTLNLVCVLFDPAIPTSSFNFIQLFLYLYNILPGYICCEPSTCIKSIAQKLFIVGMVP